MGLGLYYANIPQIYDNNAQESSGTPGTGLGLNTPDLKATFRKWEVKVSAIFLLQKTWEM